MPKRKPEQKAQERPPVQKVYIQVRHYNDSKGCFSSAIEGFLFVLFILFAMGAIGSILQSCGKQ